MERHAVIVHFGGQIRKIETELDGRAISPATPLNGDVWVVPAGHSYHSEVLGGTVRYAVIEFDPAILPDTADHQINPYSLSPQIGHSDAFLHRSAIRLAELTQRSDDLSALTSANLGHTLFLHLFLEYYGKGQTIRRKMPYIRFSAREKSQVSEYIDDHLHEHILLENLASLVNMTSHEVLKAFGESFGTTPAQYVIKHRLQRVKSQLMSSKMTIATIAVETGFASHAHLTSTFSAWYGMSPQDFRSAKEPG